LHGPIADLVVKAAKPAMLVPGRSLIERLHVTIWRRHG
jgi:hypothetical protein